MLEFLPRNRFGDAAFSAVIYAVHHLRLPRWHRPLTFNDHLFAMKLRGELDHPLRRSVTDKHLVKAHIRQVLGPGYDLETLALLTTPAEIEAFSPPQLPCIVKPTHLSGEVMLVEDREQPLDRQRMVEWLSLDHYHWSREANYKDLRPGVMVETYFVDSDGGVPQDYKVFCIAGRAKFVQVVRDRFGATTRNLYTRDWSKLPFGISYPAAGLVPRPERLGEMFELAERLAAPFSFIRVDFLVADGHLKIGELTNLPENAIGIFMPKVYDRRLGRLFANPNLEIEAVLEV
jgi:hypothetical protein